MEQLSSGLAHEQHSSWDTGADCSAQNATCHNEKLHEGRIYALVYFYISSGASPRAGHTGDPREDGRAPARTELLPGNQV